MNDLLTPAGASRILGVVPATVRQMAISGRLPAIQTESGMRLFRRDDVERLAVDRARRIEERTSVNDSATRGSGMEESHGET